MEVIRQYFGFRVVQREEKDTVPFFVFYARAKDIIQWTFIRRTKDDPNGTQRVLLPTRKRAVTRFFESNSKNTIPNNIILTFLKPVNFTSFDTKIKSLFPEMNIDNGCDNLLQWGTLTFTYDTEQPEESRPALVVDGQHRLFGMSDYSSEDIPVLVVCLLDAPLEEQAFQFVVINNKSVKTSVPNVRSIVANLTIDSKALLERLLRAGVSYAGASVILRDIDDTPTSPFFRYLEWEHNTEPAGPILVPLTAIEQCLRYIRAQFDFLKLDDDEDTLREIFFSIWRPIKQKFIEIWGNNKYFMTKVNITALNEYLVDRLKNAWLDRLINTDDLVSPESVEAKIKEFIAPLEKEFWETDWNSVIKVQDNANVRGIIIEDFKTMTQNSRLDNNWSSNLRFNPSSVKD